MKKRAALGLTVLLLVAALPVLGMRMQDRPLPEALTRAALVVHATVESADAAWSEDEWGKHIWTTYRLRVASYLKGEPRGDELTLRVLGGRVGEQTELVFDIPHPYLLQEAVFLLSERGKGGPLAIEHSVPVVDDEVVLGGTRVPVERFAEAVALLVTGDRASLNAILPHPTASVPPTSPALEQEQQLPRRQLQASGIAILGATIYDAWWADAVDNDGDGYAQRASLIWDADVEGGTGTLTVNYVVYYSPAGAGNWTQLGTYGPQTITGNSSDDTFTLTVTGDGSPARFDFAIEVYRSGVSTPDAQRTPDDDSDLGGVGLEGAAQDGGGTGAPTITSVSPSRAAAGTGTQVTINGTGFGATQGQVKFLFQVKQEGPDTVSADIVSWSDTRIVCTVPICRYTQGECGGYPGGSSSGPLWVITSGGGQSAPQPFEIPFGYGGQKWNPAQVNYRIASTVPGNFSTAIQNAFATWTAAAGIDFGFAGSTTASTPSNNGTTELTYGPLPSGTPEGVIAFALCWPDGAAVINECDMLLNSALEWSTSTPTPATSFDVESIALHEFGHWLVLLDLYGNVDGYFADLGKVMYGWGGTGPDWNRRELHADDVLGAQWIYPGSGSCTYNISPSSTSVAVGGGSGTVSVTAGSGCAWTAASNSGWISVTGGASGSGNGTVSYSVAANSGAARNGTMTIAGRTFTVSQAGSGGTGDNVYLVAGIAAASGAAGTNWKSYLSVCNLSQSPASLTLVYRHSGGSVTRSHSLGGYGIVGWDNVVSSLFGVTGQSSGAVEVSSDRALVVVARTYNDPGGGTYGQYLPGVYSPDYIGPGGQGLLSMLRKTTRFRTNVGFVNPGTASCTVNIGLFGTSGSQIGSMVQASVPAGGWKQVNDVFNAAGVSSADIAYAIVEPATAGCSFWAYASVVDGDSGDPTTVPVTKLQ